MLRLGVARKRPVSSSPSCFQMQRTVHSGPSSLEELDRSQWGTQECTVAGRHLPGSNQVGHSLTKEDAAVGS